jgi:hypothetical protein
MKKPRDYGAYLLSILACAMVLFMLSSHCSPVAQSKEDAAKTKEKLTQCENNLKDLAAALEKYASDHNATYPRALKELVPKYMKSLPACPAAGRETYSRSYKGKTSISFKSKEASDASGNFVIYCNGHYHKALGILQNYPQYLSKDGLIEAPAKK